MTIGSRENPHVLDYATPQPARTGSDEFFLFKMRVGSLFDRTVVIVFWAITTMYVGYILYRVLEGIVGWIAERSGYRGDDVQSLRPWLAAISISLVTLGIRTWIRRQKEIVPQIKLLRRDFEGDSVVMTFNPTNPLEVEVANETALRLDQEWQVRSGHEAVLLSRGQGEDFRLHEGDLSVVTEIMVAPAHCELPPGYYLTSNAQRGEGFAH